MEGADADRAKRAAAEAAAALVRDGMALGLGTGSTAYFVVQEIGRRMQAENLRLRAIATSQRTEEQARGLGIPIAGFDAIEMLDLAIDGADEVERGTLRLIKGHGGALLREKIVAQASRRFVVVADSSKLVDQLGARMALPVEVVRFGHEASARRIAALGGAPALRMAGDAPYVSDGGNLIYDCAGFRPLRDPFTLQRALTAIPGVMETGLFLDMAEACMIGAADGTVSVLRRDGAEAAHGEG